MHLTVVATSDNRPHRIRVSPSECFAVRSLSTGRLLGYLVETLTFVDTNAFTFLGLEGPVTCHFSINGVSLIGATDRCKVSLEVSGGRVVLMKKNYPRIMPKDCLAKTTELLFTELDIFLISLLGVDLSALCMLQNVAGDDDDGRAESDEGSTTDQKPVESAEPADAKTDRTYIDILLQTYPELANHCIYYDASYSMDRAISLTNDHATPMATSPGRTTLTPRIRKSGFYVYNTTRGVWLPCSNATIEENLIKILIQLPDMDARDLRYLGKNANSTTLRRVFMKRMEKRGLFIAQLSLGSVDRFALNNGFLVERGVLLRPTTPDDAVFVTSGWSYDREAAIRERDALQLFLDQVFPVKAEQTVVLRYVADLLDGHRERKAFLVLTDRRQGNNGKSTFLKLLQVFFGEAYYAKSIKFLTENVKNERHSHDAGMECMNGKRLLIADEFTRRTVLDSALIKDLISVADTTVHGRTFGQANTFKFIWQAGIIIAFNEGQFPRFDTNDAAFVSRMIVCEMRSRFLFKPEYSRYIERLHDIEPYTYVADTGIVSQFPNWCSAFLDMLLELRQQRSPNDLDVPQSMVDAKNELLLDMRDGDGQLSEWINELLEREIETPRIGEIIDSASRKVMVVNAIDAFVEYSKHRTLSNKRHLDPISKKLFLQKIETICASGNIGIRDTQCMFKRRYQSRKNNCNRQRRNVIVMDLLSVNNTSTDDNKTK